MTTSDEIEQAFNNVFSLMGEYQNMNSNPTFDGFTSWLTRRKGFVLSNNREQLKSKVMNDINNLKNGK